MITQTVLKFLQDENEEVRVEAGFTLMSLGTVELICQYMIHHDEEIRKVIARASSKLKFRDDRILESLHQLLEDETADVRAWASISLGKMGDTDVVSKLLQLLHYQDYSTQSRQRHNATVRREAGRALHILCDRGQHLF